MLLKQSKEGNIVMYGFESESDCRFSETWLNYLKNESDLIFSGSKEELLNQSITWKEKMLIEYREFTQLGTMWMVKGKRYSKSDVAFRSLIESYPGNYYLIVKEKK